MKESEKYKLLKHLPFYLFVVISIILILIEKENIIPMIIFALITGLPKIIQPFIKKTNKLINELKKLENPFYFSIIFIYIGYFFAIYFKSDSEIINNGVAFWTLLKIYFVLMIGIFIYWALSTHSIANIFGKELLRKDSMPIKEFIENSISNNVNVLAVAGNLNALGDEKGIALLEYFLETKPKSELHLFIPRTVKESLKEIRAKLNNDCLAKRVKIFDIEPFVFLQGVVFAGDIKEIDNKFSVEAIGYYLYKPIISSKDLFPSEGLFVDVSDKPNEDDFSIAIEAFYRHLRKSVTKVNGYKFNSVIKKPDGKVHDYVSNPYTLDTIKI